MTSMIERVARAIGGEENGAPVDEPVERWRNWEPAARAAIAAMREPTEGILQAMRDTVPVSGYEWEYETDEALPHWQAMIDAALEENP